MVDDQSATGNTGGCLVHPKSVFLTGWILPTKGKHTSCLSFQTYCEMELFSV